MRDNAQYHPGQSVDDEEEHSQGLCLRLLIDFPLGHPLIIQPIKAFKLF